MKEDLMGWAAVIVALTAALVAVFSQYNTRKAIEAQRDEQRRAAALIAANLEATAAKVDATHTMIDGQRTAMEAKLEFLKGEIQRLNDASGIPVEGDRRQQAPTTPSIKDGPPPAVVTLDNHVVSVDPDAAKKQPLKPER